MLKQMTQWLRDTFAEKAEQKPAVPQTATLATRHGPVRMDRAELSCGSVAYVCHKASKPENAALDYNRVEYVHTDRNTGEEYEDSLVMTEVNDNGYKSDFHYAAEQACDRQDDMDKATVVVFFDHRTESVNTTTALKELRQHFPATSPQLDRMESPKPQPQLKLVVPSPSKRPVEFKDCGLCG